MEGSTAVVGEGAELEGRGLGFELVREGRARELPDAEPRAADAPASDEVHPGSLQEAGWILDPLITILGKPALLQPTPGATPVIVPSQLLDQLAARVLRRCSVTRDATSATVRLELGDGRFDGTAVIVQSKQGKLSLEIEGDDRASCHKLAEALRSRLRQSGADVTE